MSVVLILNQERVGKKKKKKEEKGEEEKAEKKELEKKKPLKKKILKKKSKSKKKKKRAWWWYLIAGLVLAVVGYFAVQAYLAFNSIWSENQTGQSPFLKLFGDVEAGELKGEGDGRINILLLGIPGGNHGGRDLSDTNIVASIDPINKKVAMLSLPRDMWVDIPENGSCKLNAVHAYGDASGNKDGGPALSKKTIGEMLDLPIHYFIRVDFVGMVRLVEVLGGITIDVETDIYDPYFPDRYNSGYEPYSITAGSHHLNGSEALKYARSRYTTSDFDRAYRQQQVLVAIKKKISKINLFTEPDKLIHIFKVAKDHLRTDLQPWEIKKLAEIIDQVKIDEVVHKVLDNSADGLLYSSWVNGTSVLLPQGDDYSLIQTLAHRIFTEPYLEQEGARIKIQNGTNQIGLAGQTAEVLKDFGYDIIKIGDTKTKYDQTLIIDYSDNKKPHTLDLLHKRIPHSKLMKDGLSKSGVDILIILGKDFKIQDLYR